MSVTVLCGDFTKALHKVPENSVDAIITDPPYPREFAGLWTPLGELAFRCLKPGGSLLSIVPHYLIPDVLDDIKDSGMRYRWTLAMWQMQGPHPTMGAIGVAVVWKPIVWWIKGTKPFGGRTPDGFENPAPAKANHKWEQHLEWARYCLRFVPAGGMVLDPMMGSGTVGVACQELGYSFVGIDIDPSAVQTARDRLGLDRSPARR